MKTLIMTLILFLPGLALADSEQATSRSTGKYAIDPTTNLSEVIKQVKPVLAYPRSDINLAAKTALHGEETTFEIFDAWLELSGDLDDDGFYHHLKVIFDADTSSEYATVYVKLFLSYEGGPWYQYTESDLFEIHHDSADDTYEVLTELIDGYAPGYYEVLVELHSFSHHGVMDSLILDTDLSNRSIALEDREHDDPYLYDDHYDADYVDVSYGVGVSGSFSVAGMIMLMILLFIKWRYFQARK